MTGELEVIPFKLVALLTKSQYKLESGKANFYFYSEIYSNWPHLISFVQNESMQVGLLPTPVLEITNN